MANVHRPRVFLDVNIGEQPAGRLTIELFTDKTPKTAEKYETRQPHVRLRICADGGEHAVSVNCAPASTMACRMRRRLSIE